MWRKKEDKNEEDKVDSRKCFTCGASFFEHIGGEDLVASIRSGSAVIGAHSWRQTKPKLNYLLPCPNCQRHYCVKHEDMILRKIGKCKECIKES